MSYDSVFFGRDIFAMKPRQGRAWVGNYQKLGQLQQRDAVILRPDGSESRYGCDLWAEDLHRVDEVPSELIDDTVAGYQAAYLLFTKGLLKDDVVKSPDAVAADR